jgi:hypothetical protein
MEQWQPIETAPKDGTEVSVRDANKRQVLAWFDQKQAKWRSGGVHHGFPVIPQLEGHPWVEWRSDVVWRITTAIHSPINPIGTAPTDGTRVLGYDQRGGWRTMWFKTDMHYSAYWQDEFDSEPEPTHWILLPPPPTTG